MKGRREHGEVGAGRSREAISTPLQLYTAKKTEVINSRGDRENVENARSDLYTSTTLHG